MCLRRPDKKLRKFRDPVRYLLYVWRKFKDNLIIYEDCTTHEIFYCKLSVPTKIAANDNPLEIPKNRVKIFPDKITITHRSDVFCN